MSWVYSFVARILALLALGGCGDDAPPDRTFDLGSARIVVSTDGRVSLEAAGRPTWVAPPEIGPRLHRFTRRARNPAAPGGIYDVLREDETELELLPDGFPRVEGDSVVILYTSDEAAGRLVIDRESDERTRFVFRLTRGEADSVAIPVLCDEESSFFGFGEQYNSTDQRGESFQLLVSEQGIGRRGARAISGDLHTTYFAMPYWLDARGFGALFRTDDLVTVDLCSSDESVAWVDVPGDEVEWVVFHGPEPLDVVEQLGDVVGRPPPIPDWAFELWVASQGGRDAVLAEAAALDDAQIPFAALWVQDWTGIRMNVDGGFGVEYRWEADDELYPDLADMVSALHERDVRFLAYANPFIDPDLPNHFDEMDADGLLVADSDGESYRFLAPNGMSGHPDLTNPDTREYVKTALGRMVDDLGFDGWMHDFGEWTPLDAQLSDGSDPFAYHNRFVVDWQTMAHEVFQERRPGGDYAVFGRSGWTGVQEVAQIHWAGDQEASWSETDGLPTVVPALLNLGLSGQYHVTHDIAGFSGGPSTKELFMRWTELGAFTPIMRTHEGANKLENWSWESDTETTDHFRRMTRLHLALMPLFRELADGAQSTSAPILRHLMLVFPDDLGSRAIDDQFMIGDELLVAPVVSEGATDREVYLPPGEWFHIWSGDAYEGGQVVTIDAPLGSPPVFARDEDRSDLRAIE